MNQIKPNTLYLVIGNTSNHYFPDDGTTLVVPQHSSLKSTDGSEPMTNDGNEFWWVKPEDLFEIGEI